MAKEVSEGKSKRRSTVKQLSKPTQDLTREQAKKVKGGDLVLHPVRLFRT